MHGIFGQCNYIVAGRYELCATQYEEDVVKNSRFTYRNA